MFTNYPVALQIVGWGVFMGLNGYVGTSCPGLNLAALAFIGMFANKKIGIWLLVAAVSITLLESIWCYLHMLAAGMASVGRTSIGNFLQQGSGVINLIIAGVVFFILLNRFSGSFPAPVWVTVTVMALFYIAGAWAAVRYWLFALTPLIALCVAGLMLLVCTLPSYIPVIAGALLFLALAGVWGTELFRWGWDKRADKLAPAFLQAAADNQPEKMKELWNQVKPGAKKVALAQALENQNTEMIRLLAPSSDASFDILLSDIEYPNLEEIKTLVQAGAPIDSLHLARALEKGQMEIAQYLLQTGKFSQNALNKALWSVTSQYYEDEAVREKLVKLLLAHGAAVNNREGWYGRSPLHFASEEGRLELVKLLVSNGADVNAIDENGETVLMRAVEADKLEAAKFLLEHGAAKTINHVSNNRSSYVSVPTVLFKARSKEMAQLLLANGADVNIKNAEGKTILMLAQETGNTEAVNLFKSAGAKE